MKGSAGIFGLVLIVVFLASGALAAEILTNDAVVTMVKVGLGEDLIIGKVKAAEGKYDLSVDGILKLKTNGVSDTIIKAMMEASAPPAMAPARSADAAAKDMQTAMALYRKGKGAEAAATFDRLLADRPNDEDLMIWKALALLEQARALKDVATSGYKPLVATAYRILHPMGRKQAANPDWNLAMARAFWLNDRPTWSSRAAGKALALRANFVEAQIVLGDLSYDSEISAINAPGDPRRDSVRRFAGTHTRQEYETALSMPELSGPLRAEILYKLGVVSAELEANTATAREYWQRSTDADPDCRYRNLAQEKLKRVPGK